MPSPVGHALAGLTVHVLTARGEGELSSLLRAGIITSAALAPDLDLLGSLFDGQNHHQHEWHSVGFATLAAIGVALAGRLWGWTRPIALGFAAGLGWTSHLLLDYLEVDTSPPIGLMALWPFSRRYFHFPRPLFLDIGRTLEWATVRHDALAMCLEVVVLAPILLIAWKARARS
jgi:membrane-bound metal-dependent hydrolase YbcI (DUF457 family)